MDEFMHVAEIALPLLLQGLGTTAAISVLSILIAMVRLGGRLYVPFKKRGC